MSISLILLPIALGTVAKVAAAQSSPAQQVCSVSTRLRDAGLLTLAAQDTGAQTMVTAADSIDARWADLSAQLRRGSDGIWQAHFHGTADQQRCVDRVLAIDAAYGLRVQAEVLRRVREQAPAAGMSLVAETANSDRSVTMVLEVRG
ncbi:hypothetical protein ACFVAV_01355 [Nocardia sp. NPDC057663]|uniref:hypothetical protein n=1 Tax=Nocardia sp. NPDC057663 TaxID=3346201 RepID=UPI00366E09E0